MSWNVLQNSTTADAADVMDNFYHVGQGSITPKASTTMVDVSDTYDIGSSATAWKDLHCKDIEVETGLVGQGWTLESETTLTTTSASISITGLNGDNASEYMILSKIVSTDTGTANYSNLHLNTDSGTNYGYQLLLGQSTTVTASRDTSESSIRMGWSGYEGTINFAKIIIYAKTGHERLIITENISQSSGKEIPVLSKWDFIWSNSTDTITSLICEGSTNQWDPGTHIELWKRG